MLSAESERDALTRKYRGFFRPARAGGVNQPSWDPPEPAEALALDDFDPEGFESGEVEERYHAPSLPIILFSSASGVAGAVIALFISYKWMQWGIELSAGLATLALLFGLGISGAMLSAATGSRAAPVNILFSCGLILLAVFFLALCLLVGALVSTVFVRL
jgi:hypothetical protein